MRGVRSVLVTGASSGIGRATAAALLARGDRVVGTARNIERLNFSDAGFTPLALDLADLDALPQRVEALIEGHPDLDSVVFCAGYGRFGSLEEFSPAQIRALMDLNFTAQALIARGLMPHLKRHGGGDLIFIGSEAGLRGARRGSVYCASKFALRGFSQALREECGRCGVRVTLINPGMVKTEFYDELDFAPGMESGQFLVPEDVADAVLFALQLGPGRIVEEINLSPLNRVVASKPKRRS